MRFKDFIYENRVEIYYIMALIFILFILAIPKLFNQYGVGVANWDTFLYLENGRNFAKMGWGDVASIAPVLPMILAKLFLLAGHVYTSAIFNVDVVFYVMGVVVLFLIMRLRFNNMVSFVGSLIYATFTLLYSWVAIGGTDIIGVTGTLLALYFVILGCDYDSKFFLVAFPVAAYAFLSRYTAGVMLFGIIFYIFITRLNKNKLLNIVLGLLLGVVSVSWFLNEFYVKLKTPFPFLGQFSGTVSNVKVMDAGFLPDSWYYIMHLPNYLSSVIPGGLGFNNVINPMGNVPTILSYILILLMMFGFVFVFCNIYKSNSEETGFLKQRNIMLIVFCVVLFLITVFTIGSVSYFVSDILFVVDMLVLYYLFRNVNNLKLDLLMMVLFFVYMVFQSVLYTKNDRYFITVLPFIAYFITNAINEIYLWINNCKTSKIHNIKITTIISACIVMLLVFNTLSFVNTMPGQSEYENIGEATTWFSQNYPNYTNKTVIYSDNWPAITWYLNIYAQRGVIESEGGEGAYNLAYMMLADNKTHHAASFYIDTTNGYIINYPGLTPIKTIGNVTIYENSYLIEHPNTPLNSSEYHTYYNNLFQKKGGE